MFEALGVLTFICLVSILFGGFAFVYAIFPLICLVFVLYVVWWLLDKVFGRNRR